VLETLLLLIKYKIGNDAKTRDFVSDRCHWDESCTSQENATNIAMVTK